MSPDDRIKAFVELGEHCSKIVAGMPRAWQLMEQSARDPVALDKFCLQCGTVAQALGQLAERATELASDLLDGDED